MAISEACKYEIEGSVDEACEKKGISKKEAFEALEKFYNSIGVPIKFSTIKTKYYRSKKKVSNETPANPPKTHTKPEVKKQISKIADEIKAGAVADDHIKIVGDAIADAIAKGSSAKRVGTKVHTAVKKANNKRKEVEPKEIDNYRRLLKVVSSTVKGLQSLADGVIPEPETEEEAEAALCIKAALPNLCLQIARLGVDIVGIHETFYKGEQNDQKYIGGQDEHRSCN